MRCMYHMSSQAGSHCQGEKHQCQKWDTSAHSTWSAAASPSQESQGILPEI